MFTASIMPELYDQMRMVMVSYPFGARAGDVTKNWRNDIAEGKHKQDIEQAKQHENPKL